MANVKIKYCGSVIKEIEMDPPVEIKLGDTILASLEEETTKVYATRGKLLDKDFSVGEVVFDTIGKYFKDNLTIEASDFIDLPRLDTPEISTSKWNLNISPVENATHYDVYVDDVYQGYVDTSNVWHGKE